MVRRHRHDFLLDSGAITALAVDRLLLEAYLMLVTRLLSAIGVTNSIYAPLTGETASRAGVLRATAQVRLRRPISAIDAQVAAIGEERSYRRAVTIVTTDRTDIAALVE